MAVNVGEGITLAQMTEDFAFKPDVAKSDEDGKGAKATSAGKEDQGPSVTLIPAKVVIRAGHLTEPTPWFQRGVQVILAMIFIAINLVCVVIMAAGWAGILFKGGEGQPPKTLFPDVMPVGREIAFTTMPKKEVAESDAE